MSYSYNNDGLIYCGDQFSINPFCPCKLVQTLISCILLVIVTFDILMRFRQQMHCMTMFYPLFHLMAFALICNIVFNLDHKLYQFNYFQQYFYNVYFSVIVYDVALKLSKVMHLKREVVIVIHCIFGATILFHTIILILRFVQQYDSCNRKFYDRVELYFLITDVYSLTLSIVLTVIGVTYTQKQQQKLEGIYNPFHYKNPLLNIWVWISINIFAILVQFIESLFFQFSQNYCSFSKNPTINQVVKIFITFVTFQLGMISTIVFFRGKTQRKIQGLKTRSRSSMSSISPLSPLQIMKGKSIHLELTDNFQCIDHTAL